MTFDPAPIATIINKVQASNPATTESGRKGWDAACLAMHKALTEVSSRRPPVARNSDPGSSKEGARRIEPKRGSRCAEVLARLRVSPGVWIEATELANEACGGSEGLRRLRELRDDYGFNIEGPAYDTYDRTTSVYRLMED